MILHLRLAPMQNAPLMCILPISHAGSGRKMTSILPVPNTQGSLLVTSNDSRLRLFQRYTVVGEEGWEGVDLGHTWIWGTHAD